MKKKKERRVYLPRVLGSGQVMMPADLKRLHKYMLEIEHISVISDEVRNSAPMPLGINGVRNESAP
jgi:predicted TIM-barrel enzyme